LNKGIRFRIISLVFSMMLLSVLAVNGHTSSISGVIGFGDNPQSISTTTLIKLLMTGTTVEASYVYIQPDRTYKLENLLPGIYDLKVISSGYTTGTLEYIVLKSNEDKTGVSMTLVKPSSDIIIDSKDAACVNGGFEDETSFAGSGVYYGSGYHRSGGGDGSKIVTWNVSIPEAGNYTVYSWWIAGTNRATDAPYLITHADGVSTYLANQQALSGQWVKMGTFKFNEGMTTIVQTNKANGYVMADAVKLTNVSPIVPPGSPQGVGSKADNGKIVLTWNPPPSGIISGYKVYRSTYSTGAEAKAKKFYMPIAVDIIGTTWTDDSVKNNAWCYYVVTAVDTKYVEGLPSYECSEIITISPAISMKAFPNRINPVNSEKAAIRYSVSSIETGNITVRIYNLNGELVRTLESFHQINGNTDYTSLWDGKNDSGEFVSSGVYLVHVGLGGSKNIQRVVVIR